MNDPQTFWLTFTNIALGVVTLICCAAIGIGIAQEVMAKRRKRAELAKIDGEFSNLVASYDGHAFNVPGLGVTMADGGEELGKKEER